MILTKISKTVDKLPSNIERQASTYEKQIPAYERNLDLLDTCWKGKGGKKDTFGKQKHGQIYLAIFNTNDDHAQFSHPSLSCSFFYQSGFPKLPSCRRQDFKYKVG